MSHIYYCEATCICHVESFFLWQVAPLGRQTKPVNQFIRFNWSIKVIIELLLVIVVLIVRSADQSTLEFDLRKCYPFIVLNWVQLDFRSVRRTRKTNLPTNQKGYDDSETTLEKLMARRIQIFRVYFSVNRPFTFLNKWKHGPNKNRPSRFGFASSNTHLPRSQTLLRCLRSMVNWFSRFLRKSSWFAYAR